MKPELGERLAGRSTNLCFDHRRGRAEDVHVALIELAEAAALRPIGAPDRLNLIALEESRKTGPILRHHARERNGEVVAQTKICLAGAALFPALENLEDEPIAFVAVLAEQRVEVLERRGLERLEPVARVDALDRVDHVRPPPHIVGEEVAHPARGLCAHV